MHFFELAGLPVLADIVPCKVATVHGDIDSGRQGLGKSQGASQVEEPVRAPEFIGDHGAGEDDRLTRNFFGQHPRGEVPLNPTPPNNKIIKDNKKKK